MQYDQQMQRDQSTQLSLFANSNSVHSHPNVDVERGINNKPTANIVIPASGLLLLRFIILHLWLAHCAPDEQTFTLMFVIGLFRCCLYLLRMIQQLVDTTPKLSYHGPDGIICKWGVL